MQPKEVRIEVPWGHVAGKWYGSDNVRPILMVHGWQDNAGSFDTLIPLLPSNLSYLAIDLPGHGLSSHLPKGCFYHSIDYVLLLENIRQHYKWNQLSLLSHSLGAVLSFVYSSLFPERVNLVGALDTLKILSFEPKIKDYIFRLHTYKVLGLDKNLNPPEYAYEEIAQRIRDGSKNSIDLNKAKYLIERGTRPSTVTPNKFCFSRDIRVKYFQLYFLEQSIGLEYIKRIKAPYLFIKGDDRDFSESQANIFEGVDFFRQCNKQFEILQVNGTHHLHLNTPELIAGKVSEFLQKYHQSS